MDPVQICPKCGAQAPAEAFFCLQCGKKLHDEPVSTATGKQAFMYIVSALFTPLGLGWGFKYIRQNDPKAKNIGIAIVVITVVSLVINLWLLFGLYNDYFQMLNQIGNLTI